jgi:K+-sensing histidine kinase KdpD
VSQAAEADTDAAGEVESAGHFRIYLGAAPGVGKTYATLSEGQRRRGRGADVIAGFVESYGRPLTEALTSGLEVIPARPSTTAEPDLRRWTSTRCSEGDPRSP